MDNKFTKSAKAWAKIGSVRKSKTGSFYLKLGEGVTIMVDGQAVKLNETNTLVLQDPRVSKQKLLASGKAKNKEKLQEEIAKIPEYVKYDVLAPNID